MTEYDWNVILVLGASFLFVALVLWLVSLTDRADKEPSPIVWESPEMTEKAIAQANQYRYFVEEWYPTLGVWMQPRTHFDKGVVGWPSKEEAIRSAEDLYLATGKKYRVRDKGEKR